MRSFSPGQELPEPYLVQVPRIDPKTRQVETEEAAVVLPHVLFEKIAEQYSDHFASFCDTRGLKKFWPQALATGDVRLKNHP
ncbi:hypothetical protein, partial [Salmonella enterica]|uniref:hypothetical protein n=1 Tax=Salmonella enterica TaxID=28901 RepID=UPI003524FBEC